MLYVYIFVVMKFLLNINRQSESWIPISCDVEAGKTKQLQNFQDFT